MLPVDATYPSQTSGTYTVPPNGGSFASIANSLQDVSYANLLAEANPGMSGNLSPMGVLNTPQFIESQNQAGMNENYNNFLSTIIGNVYPALVQQQPKEKHESLLGEIVGCLVIAAAVAAGQEYLGPLIAGAMLGSGATAVAGAALTAGALSTFGMIVSAITTGVLAGVASAAEQGLATKVGWQPSFSLAEAVDTGAETAASLGISGGIQSTALSLGMTSTEAFTAIAQDIYKYGVMAATDMLIEMSTGISKSFDFKSLVDDMATQMAAAGFDGSVFGKPTTVTDAIAQNFAQNEANAAITGGINKAILGTPFSAKDLAAQALGTTLGTMLGTEAVEEINKAGNENNGQINYLSALQGTMPIGTNPSAVNRGGYTPTMFGAGNTSQNPTPYATNKNNARQPNMSSSNPSIATTSSSAATQVALSTNSGNQSSANILGATGANVFGSNLNLPTTAVQTTLGNMPSITAGLPYTPTTASAANLFAAVGGQAGAATASSISYSPLTAAEAMNNSVYASAIKSGLYNVGAGMINSLPGAALNTLEYELGMMTGIPYFTQQATNNTVNGLINYVQNIGTIYQQTKSTDPFISTQAWTELAATAGIGILSAAGLKSFGIFGEVGADAGVATNTNIATVESSPVAQSASAPRLTKGVIVNYLSNITNVSRDQLIADLQSVGLIYKGGSDDGSFMTFMDKDGNVQIRIDPPDNKTAYDHIHIYNSFGESLDTNLQVVPKTSPAAHIEVQPRFVPAPNPNFTP